MDVVGIEIKLKQNLEQQLKTILPMLETMDKKFSKINQTLSAMESSQKRVTQQFNNMARSIDTVSQKERGLQNINNQVKATESGVKKATKQMDMFGMSLKALQQYVTPLLSLVGVMKAMQGIGFIGGSALDFEKSAVSLQQSNLSPALIKQIISTSLKLGGSGNYAMSANDFINAFKEARPVSLTPQDALNNLPMIGSVDMQMRKIDKDLAGMTAKVLPRYFEKFAAFDDKSKRTVADAFLKVEQYTGGKIDPGTLLQQLGTAGTSIVGADPYKVMMEQAYSLKESAAGAGGSGGGGGRGRGGVGMQAVDRMVNLGVVTPAQATMMKEAGMLPGLEASSSSQGRKILLDLISGKHVLTRSSASGSGKLKTSDVQSYLLKHRPEWMSKHANDPYEIGLDFAAGADALSGNKLKGSFESTRDAHIKHFGTLPVADQKFYEARLMAGMKMTGIDFLMERSIGRYKTSHDVFAKGVAGQPGLGASGQLSIEDRWDKMIAGFTTFGNALGANENLIKLANTAMDNLTNVLKLLNDNVTPIGNFLAEWGKLSGAGMQGAMSGGVPGAIESAAGQAFQDSGIPQKIKQMSNGMIDLTGSHRTFPPGQVPTNYSNKSGNWGLVPPPPPGTALSGDLLPSLPSLVGAHAAAQKSIMRKSPSVVRGSEYTRAAVDWLQNMSHNLYATIHIETKMDSKTIVKHTINKVAKAQVKSAHTMHRAGSSAGGSYTTGGLNAGANADQ